MLYSLLSEERGPSYKYPPYPPPTTPNNNGSPRCLLDKAQGVLSKARTKCVRRTYSPTPHLNKTSILPKASSYDASKNPKCLIDEKT